MGKEVSAKIRSEKGESLVETLGALIIMVLALLMLPGAVVAAARADRSVEDAVMLTEVDDEGNALDNSQTATVTVNGKTIDVIVTEYGTDSGVLYSYEVKP